MIDLHVHTDQSDGQHPPGEVVRMAAATGVSALAITDHDVLSGLEEGAAQAALAGIDFIPGIEISVDGNRELHILGYYVDYRDEALNALCASFIRLRQERVGRIYAYLQAHGVALSEEQVRRHVPKGAAGRPHFARAMVEAGYAASVQDAFDRYLGTAEFMEIERTKPPASNGIGAILRAGGVPVLAHPFLLKLTDEALDSLVQTLKGCGLMGIECYYSLHSPGQTTSYLALARKYGLIVTCGSDFHGQNNKPGIAIGDCGQALPPGECARILENLRGAHRRENNA